MMGELPALLVPLRRLKSFLTPKALNLPVIDPLALQARKVADSAVFAPAVLLGEPDQSKAEINATLLL